MIVDDSLTVRTILKRMVETDPRMVVSATASSGERALVELGKQAPDVLLLDLEMPGMGGLAALPQILAKAPDTQVLVVSSLTDEGAEATVAALSTGAVDTMLKPRPGQFDDAYRNSLLDKIRAIGTAVRDGGETKRAGEPDQATGSRRNAQAEEPKPLVRRSTKPEILAIGASTGGIHALNIFLRAIGPDFTLPILITQHLPASFIPVFSRQIELASGRRTHIAEEGTVVRAGEILIAAGHGHMTLRRSGERLVAAVSTEPSRSGCMPSVDPMLASLADICDGRALAIILSGMGRDGADGARRLHAAGGTVWAQDVDSSAVWGMPGAVSKAGITSLVAPPDALAEALVAQLAGRHGGGHARAFDTRLSA